MANQFYVEPANPLQALMGFDQSYKAQRQDNQQNAIQAVRQQAVQTFKTDPRGALNMLLGVGDIEGYKAGVADLHNQATEKQAQAQLTESSRHNVATERLTGSSQAETSRHNVVEENKPVSVGPLNTLVTPQGKEVYKSDAGEAMLIGEDDAKRVAEQARAGDSAALQNWTRGTMGPQNFVKIQKEITRQNAAAGQNGADQAVQNAQFKADTAGLRTNANTAANITYAANTANRAIDIADKAYDALPRTNLQPVNRIISMWQENSGSPEQSAAGAAINTLVNEYARFTTPKGAPTDSQRGHAWAMLNDIKSHEQFHAVTKMMRREIESGKAAEADTKAELRGRMAPTGAPTDAAQGAGGATTPANLPSAAQSQLREGLETTFGNGQVWTLQGGQPVRVK